MTKTRKRVYLYRVFLLFLFFIPFLHQPNSNFLIEELSPQNITYYQENRCEFNFFELINNRIEAINIELSIERYSPIECFAKNSWLIYQKPKANQENPELIEPEQIKLWIFTNFHIDLLTQGLFWIFLLSMIPKHEPKKLNFSKLTIIFSIILFYLHLYGEKSYYSAISRNYDLKIFNRGYQNEILVQNYYLYLYFIILFILFFGIIKIFETRINNLINYIPFVFLVTGTFSALNLNFYYLVFTFLGINYFLNAKINSKIIVSYLLFNIFWIANFKEVELLFDIDKLRGFINSSQTYESLIYWSLSFLFFVSGIVIFVIENKNKINWLILRKNLIISSSMISIIGIISAKNYFIQFFSYYFLGLNKLPMNTLESIFGNTWRGIAPSAEGIGEFYSLVLLLSLVITINNKIKLTLTEILLVIPLIYGLLRTNNFAAITSLVILILIRFLFLKSYKPKFWLISLLIAFFSITIIYLNSIDFKDLSSRMLYEGVRVTYFEVAEEVEENELGQSLIDTGDLGFIANLNDSQHNMSSSLKYLINTYNFDGDIKYLPNIISVTSTISYIINRSEKWGIFIAKYNPENINQFLFGSGPGQFSNYYLGHESKVNNGLVLPHSSLLSYIVFIGLFGLILFFIFLFYQFRKNSADIDAYLIIFFFFINILKSDALLYISNFIFMLLIINLYKYNHEF